MMHTNGSRLKKQTQKVHSAHRSNPAQKKNTFNPGRKSEIFAFFLLSSDEIRVLCFLARF
jgi:hypothetical protein